MSFEYTLWEGIVCMEGPSKVTRIDMIAHMIVVNNRMDLVSPPPLVTKPKKGKFQTREIQFACTRFPTTLDEGTRKSKPLPEGTATHPKDSRGNKQPIDRDIIFTIPNEGMAKTTSTFCSSTSLDYNNGKYVNHPTPEDPSKVTRIDMMAHMIVVNNRMDLVSPPPLVTKPKKGKFQTVTSTSPKLHGLEASEHSIRRANDLSPKSHPLRPMGNKPPADMEPQNPTNTDLLGTAAKYQEDQTQFSKLRYQSLTRNEGEPSYEEESDTQPMILSYADVRAILFSEDEAQESEEDILGAGEEIDDNPQSDETQHQSSPPKKDKPTSSTAPHTKVSDTDSSSDITQEEKHEEAAIHYVDLKASIDDYYNENIAHRDQIDNLVEDSMKTLEKSNSTTNDLYKGLEVITQLLKKITNSIKDDPAINKKIEKASETLAKIST
nr:hypothetical protein [Tanacetum cinerariifolium]